MDEWMHIHMQIDTWKKNNTSETHEHNIVRNLITFHTSFMVCVKYPELLLE